jgi:hypothetical protein
MSKSLMLTTFIPPKLNPTIGPNFLWIDLNPETPSRDPIEKIGSPMKGRKCLGPGGKFGGY